MSRPLPTFTRTVQPRIAMLLLAVLALPGIAIAFGDADVRALLDTLPGGEAIDSQVEDGIVTLSGTVADEGEQDRIEAEVGKLDGVVSVVSAIVVEGE